MIAGTLVACLLLAGGPREFPDLEARYWFNNPVFRLKDDRDVLLCVFTTRDARSERLASQLNRLQRRPRLVVIALTQDSRDDVERFVERTRARFTIGAESDTVRRMKLSRVPQFWRMSRAGDQRLEALPPDLGELLPDFGAYGEEDLDSITRPADLEIFVLSDAFGGNRQLAVKKLFHASTADEFVRFAAAAEETEANPYVLGALQYYREVAAGSRAPLELAPATTHYRAFGAAAPDDPEWARSRAYASKAANLEDVAVLLSDYKAAAGDQPQDVVIRRLIVERLPRIADRAASRRALMELLPHEPDYFLRLRLTSSFLDVCTEGDEEAAAFLESLAETEENILHVRPMMQSLAEHLRAGDPFGRLWH